MDVEAALKLSVALYSANLGGDRNWSNLRLDRQLGAIDNQLDKFSKIAAHTNRILD